MQAPKELANQLHLLSSDWRFILTHPSLFAKIEKRWRVTYLTV